MTSEALLGDMQSRTQSQALWPAVGRQERLGGTGILLPQDFCGKTMQAVTGQPIKKIKFFRILQSPVSYPESSGSLASS